MNKYIPIFLTSITALLYVIGITYYESFLLTFGIDKSQFPISFDIMLFKGFVSTVVLGSKGLFYFYFSALGVVLISIAGKIVFDLVSDHKFLNFFKAKFKTDFKFNIKEGGLIEFSIKVFEIASGVIIIFLLVILMILLSSKAGKESATKFIDNCKNKPTIKSVLLIKNKDEKPFTGCTIACNSNQCAYQGKSKVVIINNDGTLHSEIQK